MKKSSEEWRRLWERYPGDAYDKALYLLGIYCGSVLPLGERGISMARSPRLGSFLLFKWNLSHAAEIREIMHREDASLPEKDLDALIEAIEKKIPALKKEKGDLFLLMHVIKSGYSQDIQKIRVTQTNVVEISSSSPQQFFYLFGPSSSFSFLSYRCDAREITKKRFFIDSYPITKCHFIIIHDERAGKYFNLHVPPPLLEREIETYPFHNLSKSNYGDAGCGIAPGSRLSIVVVQNFCRYFSLEKLEKLFPPECSVSIRQQIDLKMDTSVNVIFDPQKNTLRLEYDHQCLAKYENLFELPSVEPLPAITCTR